MKPNMHRGLLLAVIVCATLGLYGQVAPAFEVRTAHEQELQAAYVQELKGIANDIHAHAFPFGLDLSRSVGVQGNHPDGGGAIRFGVYQNRSVLEITGNYNIAYSAELMDAQARTRKTFQDVVLPVLNAADTHLGEAKGFQDYLIEISYHIRKKVLGVDSEGVETFALLLPRDVAYRLVHAKSSDEQQDAILHGTAYLDAEPILLWVNDEGLNDADRKRILEHSLAEHAGIHPKEGNDPEHPVVSNDLVRLPDWMRKPETYLSVSELTEKYQTTLERMVKELGPQDHLVEYAPPSFIDFHGGRYLQISTSTPLEDANHDSRYKQAARAFDEHLLHMIRPVAGYFPAVQPGFGGITLSTVVKPKEGATQVSAEFFLSWNDVQCFIRYECTAQQIIDHGIVLLDDERVDLDLQKAER